MDLSNNGAEFIAEVEGVVDHWYRDQGGWAIGIGHSGDPAVEFIDVATEDDLSIGRRLTQGQVFALFDVDVRPYVSAVTRLVKVGLTQVQFDRLVSFAFNWGLGEFPATSVLRLVNQGNLAGVAIDLVEGKGPSGRPYDKGLAGVRARREREAEAFKEATMELWHPRAERVQPADGRTGLAFIGVPWKIVLHTTESTGYSPSTANYFGNPYWPQATLTKGTIYQHLPIDIGGYALYGDGTVQTNRANAVQSEIVWRAADPDWPDALLDTVADWVSWVQAQVGVPTVFAEMFREGVTVASVDSPIRFGDQEWLDFNGICGHSNVPGGNDHWDPGRLPVDRLQARLGPTPPGEDMLTFRYIYDNLDWVFDGPSNLFFQCDDPDQITQVLDKIGVPALGQVSNATHRRYKDLAKSAGYAG